MSPMGDLFNLYYAPIIKIEDTSVGYVRQKAPDDIVEHYISLLPFYVYRASSSHESEDCTDVHRLTVVDYFPAVPFGDNNRKWVEDGILEAKYSCQRIYLGRNKVSK